MAQRIWALVRVSTDVYCDSQGTYHFFARFIRRGCTGISVEFMPDGWIADRVLPKYAMQAILDRIGFTPLDTFTVYEKDQDGNERREDYRYHDPERFAKFVRGLYPLPF